MHKHHSLKAKLGAIGGVLLLMALLSIGLTLWVTWQLEGGAAAVNEAGRMRMQTWRLAQTLDSGDAARLGAQVSQFEQSLALLRTGDPARPLFVPRDPRSQQHFAEVQQAWIQTRDAWLDPGQRDTHLYANQAERLVVRIDAFVSTIEQQLSRLTAILNAFQFAMVALVIGSGVTLLYCAHLFVFNPLARLRAGLLRVEAGDMAARISVGAQDEFGALSAGFNRMAGKLQGLYQGLETRVAEKTTRLQTEHARLQALYDSAGQVAAATGLDDLAHGFARLVREAGRADAAAVRWSDEANRRYLMLASDSLPLALAQAEHCVLAGDCFCGQPQAQASTRVIPILPVGEELALGHCAREGFQTLVSVPVRLHDRMVGEIDLFYRSDFVLADDDRALLDAMATHLAGGIEALRAQALQRESAVAEERSFIARELHDSIAQSLSFLKIQLRLLRQELKRDDAVKVERALAELDAGVHESLSDVRELLMHFRTRTNAEDITPALKATLQKFEHQTGLSTELAVNGDGLPLAPDVQVQVLHVVQEALSNVRKHAQARKVWVDVQQGPLWRVEVRDDGCGFAADVGAQHDETHVGLRIMRERAQRVGATVEVASVPGSGTIVILQLPEAQRRAA